MDSTLKTVHAHCDMEHDDQAVDFGYPIFRQRLILNGDRVIDSWLGSPKKNQYSSNVVFEEIGHVLAYLRNIDNFYTSTVVLHVVRTLRQRHIAGNVPLHRLKLRHTTNLMLLVRLISFTSTWCCVSATHYSHFHLTCSLTSFCWANCALAWKQVRCGKKTNEFVSSNEAELS